ncbi:hypothetical protein RBS60_11915 [Sinomonas sp. ASV486]|uniref:Membrane protein DUF2306 n=1 Tax=Sinomonas puerhi TaxID=3238584 RepID=A0AB39L604_9MICC|nr:hypothetical protein [Sinomonas sp. ASV486]MDQ4490901.1 hypothetical protein [Sinomonas sp. ASV486]
MTGLAWITFGLALALAVVRIPAALRRENRLMLWLFALVAMAVLLSIEGPYLAIDAALGGINLANLILRFLLYGICLLMAVRISRAFNALGAQRILLGPWGLAALAAAGVGTVVSFLLLGRLPSTVGLAAGDNREWFDLYAGLGRIYPSFTGLVLVPSLVRHARSSGRAVLRCSAGLLAAGYLLLASTNTFVLMPASWVAVMQTMNYSAVLLLLAGLAIIWIAGVAARRRTLAKGLPRNKSTEVKN